MTPARCALRCHGLRVNQRPPDAISRSVTANDPPTAHRRGTVGGVRNPDGNGIAGVRGIRMGTGRRGTVIRMGMG
ncbi:hypothetical protein [uncultured Bacteroides sp.]|uniref:hypothetical protein n=1 Tax=uncultured Bacteroides sp. TaxID=162156 RepID=UPI00259BB2E1|nr:hypothetical protein [uncultured Bacteroides sp.]